MKRLAAVALVIVGLALPVCAQRSTAHGGSSGHSAQASHRSFSAPAPRAFGGPGLNRQAGSPSSAGGRLMAMTSASHRGGGGNSSAHPGDLEGRRHRRPYISPYGVAVPYAYPESISPYPLAYADTTSTDDSAAVPDQTTAGVTGGYDAQPGDEGQPAPRSPYQPSADLSILSPTRESEEAVTIVFKDGRPAEQIHNYILTRATLFVGDSKRREIPTDQLDLSATAKVNQDAGIDFRLPDAPR